MNDKNFKKIFTEHKIDIPDKDFSERVNRHLPERKNRLPQIIMITFIAVGLILMFSIQGFAPVIDNINSLATSISRTEIPSASSIITYLSVLALIGIIAYSVVQVEAE